MNSHELMYQRTLEQRVVWNPTHENKWEICINVYALSVSIQRNQVNSQGLREVAIEKFSETSVQKAELRSETQEVHLQ